MGGAFIGVADDATAASWNPAGLAQLDAAEASVVGMYVSYSPTSDVEGFDAGPFKSSHFGLNFASVALPIAMGSRNMVAAVSYQKVTDAYSKYDGDNYLEKTTGGLNAITPSLGIQLTSSILIGASVNILTGKEDYSSEDKTGFYPNLNSSHTTDLSGTNFVVGGLLDFNPFRLGAVYKSPFALTIKNDDLQWDYSFKMPQMLGIGAAFMATENLTLAADFEMRAYKNSEWEDKETHQTFDPELLDVNQLRFGAEYLFMAGESIVPLRVGFATTPLPAEDDNGDQIVGRQLAGGIGINMASIKLDLGVEWNFYTYEIDAGVATYKYTDNYLRFIISGVFHFGK